MLIKSSLSCLLRPVCAVSEPCVYHDGDTNCEGDTVHPDIKGRSLICGGSVTPDEYKTTA